MEPKHISLRDVTLLDKFIVEKADNYIEPLRKGTPKGEPIGLSGQKYLATLICLKKFPLKEIAQTVRVSHGLLRKWRTEDTFIGLFLGHCVEFADVVVQRLKERAKIQLKLDQEYMAKSLDEVFQTPPPLLKMNEFNDVKYYRGFLFKQVLSKLRKRAKEFQVTRENLDDIFKDDPVLPSNFDEGVERVIISTHLAFQFSGFLGLLEASVSTKKEVEKLIFDSKKPNEESFELIKTMLWRGELNDLRRKFIIRQIYQMQNKYTQVDAE
jgi:hypothetical protein